MTYSNAEPFDRDTGYTFYPKDQRSNEAGVKLELVALHTLSRCLLPGSC
jgi:hypothetical protein